MDVFYGKEAAARPAYRYDLTRRAAVSLGDQNDKRNVYALHRENGRDGIRGH